MDTRIRRDEWQVGRLTCGEVVPSNTAGSYTILSDNGFNSVTVKFVNTGTVVETTRYSARRGQVKDPFKPTLEGVGYLGEGEYKSRYGNAPKVKEYTTWRSMLNRCYGETDHPNNRNYKGLVTVCDEWLNFQVYAKWFHENYVEGWELDKDFLNPDSNTYSPDNCVFLPSRLNKVLVGKSRKGDRGLPTGVSTLKRSDKFAVRINKEGERAYLGCYSTLEEAGEVYRKAKSTYIVELFEPYLDLLDKRVVDKIKGIKMKLIKEST